MKKLPTASAKIIGCNKILPKIHDPTNCVWDIKTKTKKNTEGHQKIGYKKPVWEGGWDQKLYSNLLRNKIYIELSLHLFNLVIL